MGGCEKDGVCDFTLADDSTPKITSFTRTNDELSITLESGTGLTTLVKEKLSVTFAGADCSDITLTASSPYTLTCTLES